MNSSKPEDVNPMLMDENLGSSGQFLVTGTGVDQAGKGSVQQRSGLSIPQPLTTPHDSDPKKSVAPGAGTGTSSSYYDYGSSFTGFTGNRSDVGNSSLALRKVKKDAGSTLSQ